MIHPARMLAALCALAALPALAFAPRGPARFDHLLRDLPRAEALGTPSADLPAGDARSGWQAFVAERNGGWDGWYDVRAGLPLLAQGRGVAWIPAGRPVSLGDLEALARAFVDSHPLLLGRNGRHMVLDRGASGRWDAETWLVSFRQVVDGVPVDGARMDFHVVRGNLVGFGATRWAPVTRSTAPALTVDQARAHLDALLGVAGRMQSTDRVPPVLHLLPSTDRASYRHALTWRFEFAVAGEAPTWVAEISADDGSLVAFYDDTRYERIKGGVFPVSNDGLCPTGCEQPDYPMPFADYSVNGGPDQYTGDHGLYTCGSLGQPVTTNLVGPYIRVQDNCGAINQTASCDEPLDLSGSAGTDCVVPPGSSAGNTHSARSSFYHLNRVMEKGRAWLPDNNWLKSQVTDNVNINSTCNAYWNGSVNFYRSGGGCRNTGEIAGVFVHEWGHGIDQNDGGGYDNPSEAYADIVAFFETRESCIGRGFYESQNCGGYGNACLNCTGIRDQDWAKRQSNAPSTASGFIQNNCGGGSGPCGKETHCEGYLAGETVWDLAVRDLPAMGLDSATAWQTAERLFYRSRIGSGGDAYNCSVPNSDGCGTNSWFYKFRLADDDDGNLNNGTPHGAAIFAAFNRHKIACGNAGDASNQNSSGCPSLAKPVIGVQAGSNLNTITWNAVPNAGSYRVLRNDVGCERAQIIIDTPAAPATSYVDADVSNNFTVYYRVQALGSNVKCESPVSDCVSSSAQPFAGSVRFEQATYGCTVDVRVRVTDGNVGGPSTTVLVTTTSEPAGETFTLLQAAPGSAVYVGSIPSTPGPAVSGDGLISLAHGDAITVQYIDADDGNGGTNVPRTDAATGDCIFPVISNVRDSGVSDNAASVLWNTDENSSSTLVWGETIPPQTTTEGNAGTTSHQVNLGGLRSCTIYWYEVRSTDAASNVAVSTNGGRYYRFETLGDFGQGLQPCHQGRISLAKGTLACSDSVQVEVVDLDLNTSASVADTVVVRLSSTTETVPESLVLTETGPNTSTFRGIAQVAQGAPVAGDGIVQLANGDVFTATYSDANDGAGESRVSYATALNDCAGPGFDPVRVTDIQDDKATIRFTTSEPTTGAVDWGTTAALGSTVSDAALNSSHALQIGPLAECGRVYFRVRATDAYGNQRTYDNGGQPFQFNAGIIPGVFRDGFETTTGWTLEGEWQIGTPQGKGTAPPDPTAAFAGTRVLGHDLTGLGSRPGDYEKGTTQRAISPAINASALSGGQLKFRRWLNVGSGGISYVEIRRGTTGTWETVWTSPSVQGVSSSAWTLETVAIPNADGASNLQVAFKQFGGPGSGATASGWNIDRFVVHSGNGPDYDACGACGGAPTFAGVVATADVDACANDGVTVSWKEAPAWGTGHAGSYSVYRDTVPSFTPSSANRVGTGVTGLSYTDATAPADATLYYLVRAENDETCSSGPKNGGMTDANTVTSSVSTTSSRAVPAVVNTVRVVRINGAHVRLSWQTQPNTATYRVYRSLSVNSGFGRIAETPGLNADDLGAASTQESYFYLVRAANACGIEGP